MLYHLKTVNSIVFKSLIYQNISLMHIGSAKNPQK